MLLDYFRDADLQFPGLHDKDLYDMLPTPIGEKKLNSKQSFKVNSNLNLKDCSAKYVASRLLNGGETQLCERERKKATSPPMTTRA